MFSIDVFNLIPKALKQKAIDTTVDFVVNLGKGYLSDEITRRIKKLRSDGEFQEAFEDGLQRAANRFVEEYTDTDEDLVGAISNDKTFFQNEDVQKALLAILKKPGGYLTDEQEMVIKSFDNVLPHRRNRERVNQAVIYFLKCLAEEVWNLPELRPIYELQFQRMTAEAVREQVVIQKAQLQASIAFSSDIREALLQLTDTIAEKKLLSSGEGVSLAVHHNLPQPDYEEFIGRKNELKQIHQLLSPKTRHFVITIDGIGGIGKSTLALEVANSYLYYYHKLPVEERFEAIVWTTAKQTILTGEGIITRSQPSQTLQDIYSSIVVTLEKEEEIEEIISTHPDQLDDVIRRLLKQQRTLLIVDNLETIDDERVLTFIREVPEPTKVIVTTRHRLDIAYPVRLTGMPEKDALNLIANEARRKGISLNDRESYQLFQRTGGVPLAIVWTIAKISFGYSTPSILAHLGQPTSDITKFCFESAISGIRNQPAYKVLLALSLFVTGASRQAIGYIVDFGKDMMSRDEALVSLEKLSLVDKKSNRFYMLPLTKSYARAELQNSEDIRNILTERWVDFFIETAKNCNVTDREERVELEEDYENIKDVINWLVSSKQSRTLIKLLNAMRSFMFARVYWDDWNSWLERAKNVASAQNDEISRGYALSGLGRLNVYRLPG